MVPCGVIEAQVTFGMGFAASQLPAAVRLAHFRAVDSRMEIYLLLSVSVQACLSCLALRILAVVRLVHDIVGEGVSPEDGDLGPVCLDAEGAECAGGLARGLVAVLGVDVGHDGVRSP